MHGRLRIVALALIFSLFGGLTMAQVMNTQTSPVNSTTVPVNVLPGGIKKTWCIRPRSVAANPVLCFSYQGALPTAVPTASALQELSAGFAMCDDLKFIADASLNAPWACVLSTGVTTVNVDATWR